MIGRVAKIIMLVNLPITSGVFDIKDIWWKWSLSVRGCANIIWLVNVTQTGGTWLPCSCTTGTLAVEWNWAETSCISSIIIVSQLNPSREDLVFFLMTYNTEGHSTAHLFFPTTGTLGMISHFAIAELLWKSQQEYLSAREPTVSLSHPSSMEFLHVFVVIRWREKRNIL